jgi:hypothetical protein
MHRVTRELAHQECGWKHSEGHGLVALDHEGGSHVGLDKMCLLMEVRLSRTSRKFCCDLYFEASSALSCCASYPA